MKILNFKYDPHSNTYISREGVSSFLRGTFLWTFIGIGITTIVTTTIVLSPKLFLFFADNLAMYIPLTLITFGISMFIQSQALSLEQAKFLYLVYTALTGVILSFLGFYEAEILITTLLSTLIIFGGVAAYGYLTKRDLSGLYPFISVGLISLIIAGIINIFVRSEFVFLAKGYLGSLVMMALIAFKVNQLKQLGAFISSKYGEEELERYSIYGAFTLYLSFINLFLYLLRVLASRRRRRN